MSAWVRLRLRMTSDAVDEQIRTPLTLEDTETLLTAFSDQNAGLWVLSADGRLTRLEEYMYSPYMADRLPNLNDPANPFPRVMLTYMITGVGPFDRERAADVKVTGINYLPN